MKRFYTDVAVSAAPGGFTVVLDGRGIRTPRKLALSVPNRAMAEAVAEEWRGQGETIDLSAMRITRFANTALDCVVGQRAEVIRQVAAYGETDLLCYRATEPEELVRRQADQWDPLLDWLATTHGARLAVVGGVAPRPQEQAALLALHAAVAAFDSFPLTALHMATSASGSLAIGLALAAGRIDAAAAIDAAHVDEMWQAERWGSDREAERRLASVRADIEAAAAFFALCRAETA